MLDGPLHQRQAAHGDHHADNHGRKHGSHTRNQGRKPKSDAAIDQRNQRHAARAKCGQGGRHKRNQKRIGHMRQQKATTPAPTPCLQCGADGHADQGHCQHGLRARHIQPRRPCGHQHIGQKRNGCGAVLRRQHQQGAQRQTIIRPVNQQRRAAAHNSRWQAKFEHASKFF